jgi:hypothetical protein
LRGGGEEGEEGEGEGEGGRGAPRVACGYLNDVGCLGRHAYLRSARVCECGDIQARAITLALSHRVHGRLVPLAPARCILVAQVLQVETGAG